MASINDKITDIRNSARPNSAKVTASRSTGVTTLSCDNLAGWPTASAVHLVTYQIDTNNDPVDGTQADWKGLVSGNNIGTLTLVDGTDAGNSVGDIVEMLPTAGWGQDLADALMVGHTRAGAHAASLPLTSPVLTTPVITDYTSATHTHASNAQGGQLSGSAIATGSQLADRLKNPYKFSAYMAANLNLSASTWTKAQLDTELFDTGSNFDSATNYRFVAPIAGFYQFSAQIGLGTAGITATASALGALYKNGSAIVNGLALQGSGSSTTLPRIQISKLLQLATNDYIELYGQITEGSRAMAGGSTVTYLEGHIVSAT